MLFIKPIKIRYTSNLNFNEKGLIEKWENLFDLSRLKDSEIIQLCPNCLSKVSYSARYPSYICNNCKNLLTDKKGRKVSFSNVSMSGGCQGYYVDNGKKYNKENCFIGEREFFAQEARFGGIVIMPIEHYEDIF